MVSVDFPVSTFLIHQLCLSIDEYWPMQTMLQDKYVSVVRSQDTHCICIPVMPNKLTHALMQR